MGIYVQHYNGKTAFRFMRIFSYVFYTLSKIYRAGLDKAHPDIYACGALIGLQIFNVITAMKLLDMTKEQAMRYGGGIIFVIFVLDSIFFNSRTLKKFDERWDNEPKPQRMLRRTLVILYAITSIGAFIYVGLK